MLVILTGSDLSEMYFLLIKLHNNVLVAMLVCNLLRNF